MKLQIPGLDCDDDGRTDDDNNDDNAAIDDDDAPSTDDDMPDEYWKCIEKYSTAEECAEAAMRLPVRQPWMRMANLVIGAPSRVMTFALTMTKLKSLSNTVHLVATAKKTMLLRVLPNQSH